MSKITICPHYLVDYKFTTPLEIEKNYIKPLNDIINAANSLKIEIHVSKEILDYLKNSYPWRLAQDENWKKHLSLWHTLITSKLGKHFKIRSAISDVEHDSFYCEELSKEANKIFNDFIIVFLSKDLPKKDSSEGVFSSGKCAEKVYEIGAFPVVDVSFLINIQHPWLRIYNQPLPTSGPYPFIPPDKWINSAKPARGINNGYLDINGNEWLWDKLHKNHWDLQIDGGHKNISTSGEQI